MKYVKIVIRIVFFEDNNTITVDLNGSSKALRELWCRGESPDWSYLKYSLGLSSLGCHSLSLNFPHH